MAKNKLAKFADMEKLDNVYQPKHDEIFQKDYYLKGRWHSEVFHNDNPIVLEIGCGKGEYSVGLANIFKDKNFIGIDIKGARMWKGANVAKDRNISNVVFLRLYAEMLESVFAQDEIDEIWITFPDPQMAKARKRLTGSRFLKLYNKFLKEDGIVHLKTDSNFLYSYTYELIKSNNLRQICNYCDLYKEETTGDNPILGIKTFYEQQWISRGKTIKYISFSNLNEHIEEPDVEIERDDYHSEARYMVGHTTILEEIKKD